MKASNVAIIFGTVAFFMIVGTFYIASKLRPEGGVAKKSAPAVNVESFTDAQIEEIAKNSELMTTMRADFISKCSQCHGDKGQGGIGPNLTDQYWLHGQGKPTEIVAIIRDGVPAKGMPPWRGLIKQEQMRDLAAFVLTLKGTNPPGAKAAQGELIHSELTK